MASLFIIFILLLYLNNYYDILLLLVVVLCVVVEVCSINIFIGRNKEKKQGKKKEIINISK